MRDFVDLNLFSEKERLRDKRSESLKKKWSGEQKQWSMKYFSGFLAGDRHKIGVVNSHTPLGEQLAELAFVKWSSTIGST